MTKHRSLLKRKLSVLVSLLRQPQMNQRLQKLIWQAKVKSPLIRLMSKMIQFVVKMKASWMQCKTKINHVVFNKVVYKAMTRRRRSTAKKVPTVKLPWKQHWRQTPRKSLQKQLTLKRSTWKTTTCPRSRMRALKRIFELRGGRTDTGSYLALVPG